MGEDRERREEEREGERERGREGEREREREREMEREKGRDNVKRVRNRRAVLLSSLLIFSLLLFSSLLFFSSFSLSLFPNTKDSPVEVELPEGRVEDVAVDCSPPRAVVSVLACDKRAR